MSGPKHLRLVADVTKFSDLDSWEHLYAYCPDCFRKMRLDKNRLGRKYGFHARINTLRKFLACKNVNCKNKVGNVFGTANEAR
ncbi:hypothetical protein FHW16_005427 [Phyllobacterium myrsinacearum]|uniref:Uncharacterized protein n=1 Tax=Phyllobacterium myrsinacearum TaxID=28101 RepID=A0A839ES99_9HYPH|nr:hypothetical protein [Phyllobacterium myrsinacearum]